MRPRKTVPPAEEAEVFSNQKVPFSPLCNCLLYGLHGLILPSPLQVRYSIGHWLHESHKFCRIDGLKGAAFRAFPTLKPNIILVKMLDRPIVDISNFFKT